MADTTKELIDAVDEDNNLTGVTKRRDIVHSQMSDWHRATGIWIVNVKSRSCVRSVPVRRILIREYGRLPLEDILKQVKIMMIMPLKNFKKSWEYLLIKIN